MGNYDAIIVGAGIAGLGVGGILQDNGLKTAIFEKSIFAGGRCKTFDFPGGWKLDTGTHCIELGEYSACAGLLAKLGKKIPWSRNLQGGLFYDDNKWKQMDEYLGLTEEDNRQMTEFADWMRNIGDREIEELDDVSLSKLLEDKGVSPRIAEFMKQIGMLQTTLVDADKTSAGEFLAIYRGALQHGSGGAKSYFENVRMPLGGVATMIRALEEAYKERGGTLHLGKTVDRVNIKAGGRAEIVTGEETVAAPAVVAAVPIWELLPILSMDEMAAYAPQWAARMPELERETSSTVGFVIGTRAPLLNEPYYLSAWRLPGMDLPMQILLHSNFDDTIAPAGHTLAFIGACCSADEAEDTEYREKTLAAFWELVRKMFPNVEEDLLWRQDAFVVGIDGLSRSPGMTGKSRPPVHLPEVPGLYFAGDCYTGRGVGMNSAANSAMICAEAILAKSGKR